MALGMLKKIARSLLLGGAAFFARIEFNNQRFVKFNERPIEFAFLFRVLRDIYPRAVLDVGTGTTALPHMLRNCGCVVTAIDNITDYWSSGMKNRHYHVVDDDIRNPTIGGKFDLITCISVLEHIDDFNAAIRGMFSLLSDEGSIVLTCPFSEGRFYPNVYDLPGSSYGQDVPYKTQSFSQAELHRWLADNNAELISAEYWQCWSGNAWTVGEQVIPPRLASREELHQLACFHIKKIP